MIKNFLLFIFIPVFTSAPPQQDTNHSNRTEIKLAQDLTTDALKEALTIATQNSTKQLSAIDGFFANAAIKILMPPEAENVEKTLRLFGMGSLVDKTIISLHRSVADAANA